jgi:SAM-dependent methyltransferase
MIERKHEYVKMAAVEERLWWYKALHSLVYSHISDAFSEKLIKIADAGCGTGGMIKFLTGKGYQNIDGFDISEEAVGICKDASLPVFHENIVNISNHYQLQSLDVIISNDTFYFITEAERKQLISDFYKLLRPNGIVLLNLPALNAFRGIHDISVGIGYRFSKKDIKKMIDKEEFSIQRVNYWPFFLSPIIYFSRFFQRIKLKMNKNIKIESDIDLPPDWINKLLFKLTRCENNIFRRKPFGSSLFLVLRRNN